MTSPLQSSPPPPPHHYRAFGRTVECFTSLPAFPVPVTAEVDWRFQLCTPLPGRDDQGDDDGVTPATDSGGDTYDAKGFARFVVRGPVIDVHPRPGVNPSATAVPIAGSLSAVLLGRAGHLVLHGTALRHDGRCFIFCGNAGAGKSTQAAYLVQQGWQLVSDDVSAISWEEGRAAVLRGFAALRLFPKSLELLGVSPLEHRCLYPGTTKRLVLAADLDSSADRVGPPPEVMPLAGVIVLEEGADTDFTILSKRQALLTLLNFQHPGGAGAANRSEATRSQLFAEASRLAEATPLYRLRRPKNVAALADAHRMLAERG